MTTTDTTQGKTYNLLHSKLIWAVLLLNLAVIMMVAVIISQIRSQHQKKAEQLTQSFARIVKEHIEGDIRKIDTSMLAISDEFTRQQIKRRFDTQEFNTFIERRLKRLEELDSLRVVDKYGIVKYGPGIPLGSKVDVSDRPYFIYLSAHNDENLFVSAPIFGRINNKWVLPIVRRLNHPDRSFAGLVIALVSLDNIKQSFTKVSVGVHGIVSLRDSDMNTIMRYPAPQDLESIVGKNTLTPELQAALNANKELGTYRVHAVIDNIERTYSYEKLHDLPLYVTVGFASEDYLAEWREFSNKLVGLTLLLFLISSSAIWFINRGERRQLQDYERLNLAASVFTNSREGILITDANSAIVDVNEAFTRITGYSREEALGKNPRFLSSGRQNKDYYETMWRELLATGHWYGEIWNRRKNGEVFAEMQIISAVYDLNNNVKQYVGQFSDITSRKTAEDAIKTLAFYDPLTGLPNRRLLTDRLKWALSSSARTNMQGAVLFIDLDNFKMLNDTLGHDIGDLLLQQVARRLELCVREGDTVARLGGDEFVVMLEDLSAEEIEAASKTEFVGNKILSSLQQPYLLDGHEQINTPSIGAALFSDHDVEIEELFKQADIAMYQAKKAGRNQLRFFNPEMQRAINLRATLERELGKALELHQFQLYFQTQVDHLLHPVGAEVLIRWINPTRGVVPPDEFIHLMEENGLILPVGNWVLRTACKQIILWQQDELTRHLTLAVNVSAKQFHQWDFVDQVKTILKETGANPSKLKLELTESMLVENIAETIANMDALKAVGVHFSLDDFGTGYSSLQYLKNLPLDQLKIDQSFVREINADRSSNTIIRTIIAMAHSLNLDVIAEGVETEDQRQALLDIGCSQFQGYLIGRPVPIEQFEALLKPA
jgi:diguanylate cyclase (GGDEF)-like protein/PAS domain S-box-containing protein